MSAGQNNAGVSPLTFKTTAEVAQYVFVTIDKATDTVSVGATATPDGITVQPSDINNVVAVVATKSVEAKYYVRAGVDITLGDELESDANGFAIVALGTTGVFAKKTVKTGGLVPVYSF